MTHTTEQERAEFEKHILAPNGFFDKGRGWVDRNPDGSYKLTRIQERWLTWQAARRAPAVPVPQGLREAAQAVVERWDTPLWKDVPATAVYIADLRAALAAAPQPPEASAHTT